MDSETGRLRAVLLHRPGAELRRVTPPMADRLMFTHLPWPERAREEHDALASALRSRDVQVLYLTELLDDVLEYEAARQRLTDAVLAEPELGEELRGQLRDHLESISTEALAEILVTGLASGEFNRGSGPVFGLLGPHEYIIPPLPNLVFARDWSVWLGDNVAVTAPAGRRAEAELAGAVVTHHPLFAGIKQLYEPGFERLCGGDVLLLAPGVVAIGIGRHTSPAGAERLARRLFDAGCAHTVLAVLTDAVRGHQSCLDTMCTVAGPDTVVMPPALAYSLTARTISQRGDGLRLSHPRPFLEAAAHAMGVSRLNLIETGMSPAGTGRSEWDDACNLLVLEPGTVLSYERNALTNARLEAAGITVIGVPGSELAGPRGGPRALCCPVSREAVTLPEDSGYLDVLYRHEPALA